MLSSAPQPAPAISLAGPRRRRACASRSSSLLVCAAWGLRRLKGAATLTKIEGDKLVIGRTTGDLIVRDDAVSSKHCELRPQRSCVLVKDLGSTNGTSVNGVEIGSGGSAKLRLGQILEVGDTQFVLELEESEQESEASAAIEAAAAEGAAAAAAAAAAAKAAAGPRRPTGGLSAKELSVGKKIGGGTFGTVFEGTFKGERVILKQANVRVEGAIGLLETELQLNELCAARASAGVADYIGALEVSKAEARPVYSGGLAEGLWLVWRWQGAYTLAYYLTTRSRAPALAAALGLFEESEKLKGSELDSAICVEALRQMLTCLKLLHAAGLVHCDVKPANILLLDQEGAGVKRSSTVRLIDLGGAASCLNEPLLNYTPGSGVHDPLYSPPPPEENLLAADARAPTARTARGLWKEYTPQLFDMYSVGVVLVQLAIPRLRTDAALKSWRAEFEGFGGDVLAWRDARAAQADGDVLGEDDGEGWELLAGLLAPRQDEKGRQIRLSAEQALAHPFLSSGSSKVAKEKKGKGEEAAGGTQARKPVEAAGEGKPAAAAPPAKPVVNWPWSR